MPDRHATLPAGRARSCLKNMRQIARDTIGNYIASESPTRGAAIAFYAVTSLIPVLVMVVAIAGLAFGEAAAREAIVRRLSAFIGSEGASLIQAAIESASSSGSNGLALIVGVLILALTVSGVFGELQSALNAIWTIEDQTFSIFRLMRGRAASVGLVIGLGFLLLVSLLIDTGVRAASGYIDRNLAYSAEFFSALSMAVSFVLTWTLFAAIYKVLPDKGLRWGDVLFGALVTAIAFEAGKHLIGLYLGSSSVISGYGAAGALASVLLWIYYSAQIFLLGASFTKACAVSDDNRHGQGDVPA
jgi:membrane protein